MVTFYEFGLYNCRYCDNEFLTRTPKGRGKATFCPICGENEFTEKVRVHKLDRASFYKRKNFTQEEDDFILTALKRGMTYRQVSQGLEGRSQHSIRARYKRLLKGSVGA